MARKGRSSRFLQVAHPDSAGIDVGKKSHYVAVDPDRFEQPVRRFGSFTDDLEALASWLKECEVKVVALESTGVYWIPIYEILDRAGFEVQLVNPRATKQVSGRKSDVLDCQWLWQLMTYGLLKGAFRPGDGVCELRAYVRQRSRLIKDASRCVQHMQKALTEMNVQLDNVLSELMGKTGQRILRAIVNGERDGQVLAQHRDRRVKADVETIARSLQGNWRAEHLFALEQALARYDFLQAQIQGCEQRMIESLDQLGGDQAEAPAGHQSDEPSNKPLAKPARDLHDRAIQYALRRMLGVDLTAIPTIGVGTALAIASEIGPDLSRFPSCGHFCSWLTLAPGTRISGERSLGGKSPKRMNRAGQALLLAASTARHSDSFIGASHRARLTRLDSPRAIKATAHQLARLIYAMLTQGQQYVEQGIQAFEEERQERQVRSLHQKAQRLGYTLHKEQQMAA